MNSKTTPQVGLLLRSAALLLLTVSTAFASETHIAVAANFTDVARRLAPLFEEQSGHEIAISYGSTGKLYAQIEHGAPYDLFLAADTQRPERAEKKGLAVPGSGFIYAKGRLVLWSADDARFSKGVDYLKSGAPNHVAIANPKTAPYGTAAREVMQRLGLWPSLQRKLVKGDSIAQTFQFVATENAEAGFVAYSQVKGWRGEPGAVWEIPSDYYTPIEQGVVLLKRGRDNPAALAFLEFLKSDAALELIEKYGYDI
ncbi:MAG: molybdate ABC transporter substrate-binding protein [Candidatus Sedimenticola sp. 20ELBAFRAG]